MEAEFLAGLSGLWFVIFCLLAFATFTIASTLGVGAPLIMVPTLMLVFPADTAVALMAPVMLFSNGLRAWIFREKIAWPPLRKLAWVALPAAAGAAFLTGLTSPLILKLFIAGMILFVLARKAISSQSVNISDGALYGLGAVIGFISGWAGTAGPPTAIALRGRGLVLQEFVATVAALQVALQLMRLPGYAIGGSIGTQHIFFMTAMSLATIPSVYIARWLLTKLDAQVFEYLLDGLLFVIAVWLVAGSLGALV